MLISQIHGKHRLGRLLLGLSLAASLAACGGDRSDAVEDAPVEPVASVAPATAIPPTELPPTEVPPTEPPAEPSEAPTEPPTETPTAAPTAIPATAAPTEPPAPTATPAAEWFVEFYPDNWVYQLAEDQLCAGINWRSAGVTDLVFGREGFGSEPVEAEGRKGDICFPEKDANFFLEFRRPDGQVERKTMYIDREK